MARTTGVLVMLAGLLAVLPAEPGSAQLSETTAEPAAFLGIRVLKVEGAGSLKWSVKLPSDCAGCRLVENDYTRGENAQEFFFHVWVPRSKAGVGPFRVQVDPTKVRGILASYSDPDLGKRGFVRAQARAIGMAPIQYKRGNGEVSFSVPATLNGVDLPPDDIGDVTQQYTFIETPGVYIRVSHADQRRRRGPYATGPWPALEAKASLNLEFATREAIYALGIDKTLSANGAQTIMLMNFDTNYPTLGPDEAHEDWPPHWHMHVYWKDGPKVRKVSHFYISTDGLLIEDFSSDLKPSSITARYNTWYARGEPNVTLTATGAVLYSQTVTTEGYFKLSAPSGSCLLTPIASGFDSGATVTCSNGAKAVRVRAEDDPVAGRLLLFLNGKLATEYRYDPDTGAVFSTRKVSQ